MSSLVRVPFFNGNEKNFQSRWIKFQAYSQVEGFHMVLSDAGITITEDDIKVLESKPLHSTGGAGA